MKSIRPAPPLRPSAAMAAMRAPQSWLIACLVVIVIPAGVLARVDAVAIGSAPGFPDVPLPPPAWVALWVLTALLACGALDTIFRRLLGMSVGLQPLAIVLGVLGFSVAIEVVAYLQPRPAGALEQRYHFAMQHLAAVALAGLGYVAVRRLLLPSRRSALSAVLEAAQPARRAPSHAMDVFAALNLALFVAMTVFFYQDRFIHYRGQAHLAEFYFYAIIVFALICALWRIFRHAAVPAGVLVMLQVGILMHFAGGLVFPEAGRLYDVHLGGVRYDKYVHLVNGCAAGLLVGWVWARGGVRRGRLAALTLVLAVLGLGGVVEIAEYAVYCTVAQNGVGGYDNNMQDLFSNLAGALGALLIQQRGPIAGGR